MHAPRGVASAPAEGLRSEASMYPQTAITSPPRILFVSHSSQLNGAERSLLACVTALLDRGLAEPMVILPADGALRERLVAASVPVAVCPCHRWVGKRFLPLRAVLSSSAILYALLRCHRRIRAFRPHLVYSNSLATGLGIAIAAVLRVPHLLHAREFLEEDFGLHFDLGDRIAWGQISRTTSQVICNSQAVARKLSAKLPETPCTVVYNGIDCAEYPVTKNASSVPETGGAPFRLLMLGTISRGKNQIEAIRALALLHSKGIAADLYLVGKGKAGYVDQLEIHCRDLGVSSSVHFLGFLDDVSRELSRAHMLLVCSRAEAFGRVAIEAMCACTPVVAARSGGLPEVIEHGVTGLLYEPGNPQDLAATIERLMGSSDLRREIADHAYRTLSKRFSMDLYVTGIASVLTQVLTRRSA